ncbi:BlaI/MecI/CopY family transcriptional regulator [Zongyangia hominis]|uniref:BlaI/MecI/CopY family transcriptional regulator n=1 Tax=Zongyangia hominis TaxID=2763677 RepID=A0A926IB17_9FIRM|nr:BlaI/MecI/CopY family transcriptional regulator [Zongyangia hominis]MBC8569702.1 BlaI/MecI/CopY family transcriptional regulator [Zongyangia hominis]
MDKIKIGDGEIRIMEYIWEEQPVKAGELVIRAKEDYGWSKNTTYTMLKRLAEKGMIDRSDPGFVCRALVTREQVQQEETRSLIDKVYNGSRKLFLTSFLSEEKLTEDEIEEIKKLIDAHP